MDVIRESLAGKVAVVIGVGPGQGNAVARLLINFGSKIATGGGSVLGEFSQYPLFIPCFC